MCVWRHCRDDYMPSNLYNITTTTTMTSLILQWELTMSKCREGKSHVGQVSNKYSHTNTYLKFADDEHVRKSLPNRFTLWNYNLRPRSVLILNKISLLGILTGDVRRCKTLLRRSNGKNRKLSNELTIKRTYSVCVRIAWCLIYYILITL